MALPRRRLGFALAATGTALATVAVLTSAPAGATDQTGTVSPVADTTITQVPQDGDTSTKTTLATCPRSCEGNPDGERDALVGFTVTTVPAGATHVTARIQLYSWNPFDAAVTAYPASGGAASTGGWQDRPTLGTSLGTHPAVTAGYNEWDVSAVVTGNGDYTFAFLQTTHDHRVYWGSRENTNPAVHPRLLVSYDPPATPTATPTSPPGWNLVWSDEFDGTALDTTKWTALNNTSVDYDRACITSSPQNVFVSGGVLTLRARRQDATCGSQHRGYTTAYLNTVGKASFTYGRFEMRAKSPNGPTNSTGLWPAFWMRPNDGGHGEIDVVELPGGGPYYRAATQAIFYDYTPTKQDNRFTFPTGYPGDGFHTYVTEWEPGVIRWYIDGTLVWSRDRTTTPWFDEALSRPFNLRLNFQVGGWLGDPTAATTFPADFQVDYIRVYQR